MSILSHLHQHPEQMPRIVKLLYSGRGGPSGSLGSMLFLDRLRKLFAQKSSSNRSFEIFCTAPDVINAQSEREANMASNSDKMKVASMHLERIWFRRMSEEDLLKALGPVENRRDSVAYVCGPPTMTDWAVDRLKAANGMRERNVLCEKWW